MYQATTFALLTLALCVAMWLAYRAGVSSQTIAVGAVLAVAATVAAAALANRGTAARPPKYMPLRNRNRYDRNRSRGRRGRYLGGTDLVIVTHGEQNNNNNNAQPRFTSAAHALAEHGIPTQIYNQFVRHECECMSDAHNEADCDIILSARYYIVYYVPQVTPDIPNPRAKLMYYSPHTSNGAKHMSDIVRTLVDCIGIEALQHIIKVRCDHTDADKGTKTCVHCFLNTCLKTAPAAISLKYVLGSIAQLAMLYTSPAINWNSTRALDAAGKAFDDSVGPFVDPQLTTLTAAHTAAVLTTPTEVLKSHLLNIVHIYGALAALKTKLIDWIINMRNNIRITLPHNDNISVANPVFTYETATPSMRDFILRIHTLQYNINTNIDGLLQYYIMLKHHHYVIDVCRHIITTIGVANSTTIHNAIPSVLFKTLAILLVIQDVDTRVFIKAELSATALDDVLLYNNHLYTIVSAVISNAGFVNADTDPSADNIVLYKKSITRAVCRDAAIYVIRRLQTVFAAGGVHQILNKIYSTLAKTTPSADGIPMPDLTNIQGLLTVNVVIASIAAASNAMTAAVTTILGGTRDNIVQEQLTPATVVNTHAAIIQVGAAPQHDTYVHFGANCATFEAHQNIVNTQTYLTQPLPTLRLTVDNCNTLANNILTCIESYIGIARQCLLLQPPTTPEFPTDINPPNITATITTAINAMTTAKTRIDGHRHVINAAMNVYHPQLSADVRVKALLADYCTASAD